MVHVSNQRLPAYSFHRRPSRLIDVENQCIVRGNVQGQHLALSYIWQNDTRPIDNEQQFQLLLNNAEDLAAPNSIKQHYPQLPKVIQDAMELTTAIPKKYLWVNRLCIIQDDPQREEEVMRMDQIYSGAYMTIIAAAEHGLYCTPVGTVHNPAIKSPKDWFENSWCRLAPNERILEYYDTVSRSK
jgi:hypothetical protein